jgi:hypothetical protein
VSNIASAVVVAISPSGDGGALSNIVSAELSVGGAGGPTKFGSDGLSARAPLISFTIDSVDRGGGGLSNIASSPVAGTIALPTALSTLVVVQTTIVELGHPAGGALSPNEAYGAGCALSKSALVEGVCELAGFGSVECSFGLAGAVATSVLSAGEWALEAKVRGDSRQVTTTPTATHV